MLYYRKWTNVHIFANLNRLYHIVYDIVNKFVDILKNKGKKLNKSDPSVIQRFYGNNN